MHTPHDIDPATEAPAAGERLTPPAPPPFHQPAAPEALLPGARLDEFEIVRVLGAGGFGIVYLALDQLLLRYVAIKEFIPTSLAGRNARGEVAVRSPDAAETFEIGLDSFYNEGRLLARFDNPSLVRVFRFWKANGTAYMAMQYYPGQTLKEARRQMSAPPDEAWLRSFVDRLLGALETLHAQGVYHRDIAPDNILLLPDGQPVVLDFGSARRVISDRTQSLTAILKPNYSPVEQYADDAGMRQGGYTDLYALGGTVYFMLTGKEPTPAVMRAVRDSFPVLAQSPAEAFAHVSREFLAAIDWSLGVSPADRPQTVAELRAALRGEIEPPPPSDRQGVLISDPSQPYDASRAMARTELADVRPAPAGARPPAAEPDIAIGDSPLLDDAAAASSLDTTAPPSSLPPPVAPRPRRPAWLVLSGVATVTACAALLWTMLGTPAGSSAEPAPQAAAAMAPPAAASEAVSALAAASVASAVSIAEAAVPAPLPASAPADTASAPRELPRNARTPDLAPARPAARATARVAASASAPAEPSVTARIVPSAPAPAAPMPVSAVPCPDMNFFARAACMNRACETPQWSAHPQCLEARRIAERRQQRMDQ